jgi:hypothetical protein
LILRILEHHADGPRQFPNPHLRGLDPIDDYPSAEPPGLEVRDGAAQAEHQGALALAEDRHELTPLDRQVDAA